MQLSEAIKKRIIDLSNEKNMKPIYKKLNEKLKFI